MKLPRPSSDAYKLYEFLAKNGPTHYTTVAAMLGKNPQRVRRMPNDGYGEIDYKTGIMNIHPSIRAEFNKIKPPAEKFQGEIVKKASRDIFANKEGFVPTYMQCMRPQPEWVKPDSFSFALA